MDTHAALTSTFHAAWSTDPGTPIYDALTTERRITPAGPPDTPVDRVRGMFEPVLPTPQDAPAPATAARGEHPYPGPPDAETPTTAYPRNPARLLAER